MSRSPRTALGLASVPTDVAGIRRVSLRNGDHIAMAIGNGRTPAGIGSAMNRGHGLVITMAHGLTIQARAGSGFRELNGHRPGSTGAWAMTMSAGCPVRRRVLSSRPHTTYLSKASISVTKSGPTP